MSYTIFALRRVLLTIPTLFLIVTFVFFVMRVVPGDPAVVILGPNATAESLAALRDRMGLNEPLLGQYVSYLAGIVRGDLGRSVISNNDVLQQILYFLPYSAALMGAAMLIALIIALPLGILSALYRNTAIDYVARVFSLIGLSLPVFYLGILLLMLFSVQLSWFPVISDPRGANFGQRISVLVLPALTLGLVQAAFVARMTRSSVLEVLQEEYVRTARAKGLAPRVVVYKHALRNAMIPIVIVIGLYMGILLGGSVLTEVVFSRPGLGGYLVGAIYNRDYPVIQGGLIVFGFAFSLINVLVDLTYGLIDPRVSYS